MDFFSYSNVVLDRAFSRVIFGPCDRLLELGCIGLSARWGYGCLATVFFALLCS
jgi:hypothetical protein